MDWLKREDHVVFHAINHNLHSPVLDPISTVLSYSGLGWSLVAFALLLALSKSTRPLTVPILVSMLLAGAVIADAIFKQLLPRDRPSHLADAIREEPHLAGSFPSGHSSVSFATAFTILLLTWGTPRQKWGWLAVIWASFVGLSRIYRGVHWPTDVVAGACVGLFSAAVVVYGTQVVRSRSSRPSATRKNKTPRQASRKRPSL